MRLFIAIFICFVSFEYLYAQDETMIIRGNVVYTDTTTPVEHAVIMAVRLSDSLLLGFQRSDKNGMFELSVPIDTFTLIVSHPKYDSRTFYIIGSEDNKEIEIQSLKLYDKSTYIDELIIYAYKDPVHYRGDTLVYIADSFKVKPNAVVEDLLKKLPGLEVDRDGKIKVHGRSVDKVLVDGDEFFGKDPTMATKNLGADAIETIEIYEKVDEDNLGSDEKIQILDLKLKEDAKKGYFGKTSLASDMGIENNKKPFYEGEILYNTFTSKRKISVFGLGTNTPKNDISSKDQEKFGLSDNSGIYRGYSPLNGIPKTFKSGVYYKDKLGKNQKAELNANYTYSNTEMDAYSSNRTQVFLSDTNYTTNDSIYQYTQKEGHQLNIRLKTPLDSLTELIINPSLKIENYKDNLNNNTNYIDGNALSFLHTQIDNNRPKQSIYVDSYIRLKRKFRKEKREVDLDYKLTHDETTERGELFTQNTFFSTPLLNDTVDQTKYNARLNSKNSITGTYTEPIGKSWKTSLIYQYNNNELLQDRITNDFNPINNTYSTYRSDLSNDFKTIRNEHKIGARLEFDTTKHHASFRLDYREIAIGNINRINDFRIDQNISNLLPSVRYRYRPSMSQSWHAEYKTYSQEPSINNLQPVPDNSDPNRIKEGNPDLKPSYTHSFSFWQNSWNAISGSYTWMGGYAQFTNNDFADSTVYNSFGQMNSKSVNVNGNIYSSVYGGLGIPLKGRIIQLRPQAQISFNRYNNFINGERNMTRDLSFAIEPVFVIELDSFQLELSGSYTHYEPKNSLSSVSNMPFGEQLYKANIDWQLIHGWSFSTDFRYTITNNLTRGYNINSFVWNIEVSKSFLQTNNLIISVIAKDLLNENITTRRTIEQNMIIDNRTRVISRYFLLKVMLKFNNKRTREDEKKSMFQ